MMMMMRKKSRAEGNDERTKTKREESDEPNKLMAIRDGPKLGVFEDKVKEKWSG
jgi:hypothetical protein